MILYKNKNNQSLILLIAMFFFLAHFHEHTRTFSMTFHSIVFSLLFVTIASSSGRPVITVEEFGKGSVVHFVRKYSIEDQFVNSALLYVV